MSSISYHTVICLLSYLSVYKLLFCVVSYDNIHVIRTLYNIFMISQIWTHSLQCKMRQLMSKEDTGLKFISPLLNLIHFHPLWNGIGTPTSWRMKAPIIRWPSPKTWCSWTLRLVMMGMCTKQRFWMGWMERQAPHNLTQ